MAWVRVDDAFYDHPKFHHVNALGLAVWIAGLAYCNRNLTDGFIPRWHAHRLVNCEGLAIVNGHAGREAEPEDGIAQLLAADAWAECEGGYEVVNYLEFQRSAAEIKAERERAAARKASWRARHAGSPGGSHAGTDGGTDGGSHGHAALAPTPTPTPKKNEELSVTADAATPSAFDEFWSVYPRKVGKRAARTAFARAAHRTDAAAVIAGARRYAADPNREDAFTAHPSTWLNRDGWDDDPLPPRIGATPTTDPLATARAWATSEESA